MLAVMAAFVFELAGRPADAVRWADVVDRRHDQDAAGLDHPAAEAWAAMLRATLCRRGIEQMRADADEAARKFADKGIRVAAVPLLQGIARILCGDRDGGDDLRNRGNGHHSNPRTQELGRAWIRAA